ncbi:MAG: hypothetical protein M1840_002212 [Geoglossum simile]|nr:MAG: hypothetical protein M1840_002212 [Geoglossum simile]
MNQNEGLRLLQKSANLGQDLSHEGRSPHIYLREIYSNGYEERSIAAELLQLLGYLSLAIEQAGAHISVQLRSPLGPPSQLQTHALRSYLDAFKKNAKVLLERKPARSTWDYRNNTVFTTWEVSYATIREERPEAAQLLLLCGFFVKSDIFEEMLHYSRMLPANGMQIQQSIHLLSFYSLVSFRGSVDAFFIYLLIHFWAQERLTLAEQQNLTREATELISRGLRLKEEHDSVVGYWDFERRVIPYLDAALKNVQKFFSSNHPADPAALSPPREPIGKGPIYLIYEVIEGYYMWLWGIVHELIQHIRFYYHPDVKS